MFFWQQEVYIIIIEYYWTMNYSNTAHRTRNEETAPVKLIKIFSLHGANLQTLIVLNINI